MAYQPYLFQMAESTSSSAERRASHSVRRLAATVPDSRGKADWHLHTFDFFETCARVGLCGRTSRARLVRSQMGDAISTFFSRPLQNAGMISNGECLTLHLSLRPAFLADCRADGPACSLSDVVQDCVDSRCWLIPKSVDVVLTRCSKFMPTALCKTISILTRRFARPLAEMSSER